MKIAYVLLLLAVGVMSFVLFHAGHQEMKLINFRARIVDSEAETVREEHAIVVLKTELVQLKNTVKQMNTNILDIKKKKQSIEQLSRDFTQRVQSCTSEKVGAENKKTETEAAIESLKVGHEEAKLKAAVEMQVLKQQILERDIAICVFADTTKDKARSLCGMPLAVPLS
ncbi:uncharacterized protein [Pseudochaenichthys georgianus]|uniref:uncharacterized protein n=1 Tax=Pseudochaenichthys georgianus TaxID=52239 RepID=UPI00146D5444|nr:uncharacterized protein si:dkey-87o1.2 [Pseudochaenichthys georgianus]